MRISIRLIATLCCALPSFGARPQAANPLACPDIESDAERLACYDRALRPARPAAPAVSAATPAPAAVAATGAAATGAAAAAGVTAAARASESITTKPRTEVRDARAPAPLPVDPNASVPLGVVPIVVVGARTAPGRPTEFTTENGEVWVQTDSSRTTIPDTPFTAEIKPGAMGSTFLVPANRHAIRVHKR